VTGESRFPRGHWDRDCFFYSGTSGSLCFCGRLPGGGGDRGRPIFARTGRPPKGRLGPSAFVDGLPGWPGAAAFFYNRRGWYPAMWGVPRFAGGRGRIVWSRSQRATYVTSKRRLGERRRGIPVDVRAGPRRRTSPGGTERGEMLLARGASGERDGFSGTGKVGGLGFFACWSCLPQTTKTRAGFDREAAL